MKKSQRVALILVTILVSFGLGVQQGVAWEGTTSSWSPGYFEEQYINATTEFYRAGLNYTAWIDSLYPHVPAPQTHDYLIAPYGSAYAAYYGVNESRIFSDTRAHNVVEWVMGNDTDGGKIAFAPGEFTIGEYLDVDACDSGWVSDDADVTVSHDAGVKQEGTASTKMVVAAGFTTGLMAHKQLPATIDGSAGDVLVWWARGTVDIGSNKLSLKLDDATDCSSPYAINSEWFHPETLGVDTWKRIQGPGVTSNYGVPIILTSAVSINSVGVYGDADPGAVTLYLDDIDIGVGVIKVDDGQAWTFTGAGMNQTVLTLADGANMPVFYVTADETKIEKMSVNGRAAYQHVIDGCSGIYYRYADNVVTSEVYLYDIKGTAIKHRDLSYADVLHCRGANIENPFVSGSASEYIHAQSCTSYNVTNDDHYWFTSGSDHIEVESCTMKLGVSGGVRVTSGSGEWYDINIHDCTIEDMGLQFIQIDDADIYGVVLFNNWCNNSDAVGFRVSNLRNFKIILNHIGYTKQHGLVMNGPHDGIVSENTFESINYDDLGSYDGIRHSAHNVTFSVNIFVDYSHGGGNESMHRCIREEGTPEECVYYGNQFRAHTYNPAITVVATDSEFMMNPGFVTENYGSETIIGGQWVEFAHGLYTTPDVVLAGFNDTIEWSWTAGTTNVNITVDTSGNYVVAWFAKSDPTI